MSFADKIVKRIVGDKSKDKWMRKYDCPKCGKHTARKTSFVGSTGKEKGLIGCDECGYEEEYDYL